MAAKTSSARPRSSPRACRTRSPRSPVSPTTTTGPGSPVARSCSRRSARGGSGSRNKNPVRVLLEASRAELQRASEDQALARAGPGAARRARRGPRPATRVGWRHRSRPSGRVPVRRVRHPRLAPDLLGRSRRARRRPRQGGLRPGGPARRRRPALPQGLLPPADRCGRLAARVLDRHRSGSAADGTCHRGRRSTDQHHDPDL